MNADGADVAITNSEFDSNIGNSASGGAITLFQTTSFSAIGSTFSSNSNSGSGGGAIYMTGCTIDVTGSYFSGNSGSSALGDIYARTSNTDESNVITSPENCTSGTGDESPGCAAAVCYKEGTGSVACYSCACLYPTAVPNPAPSKVPTAVPSPAPTKVPVPTLAPTILRSPACGMHSALLPRFWRLLVRAVRLI